MPTIITTDQRQKALRIYARALPLIADAIGLDTKALHNNVLRRVLFDDLAALESGTAVPPNDAEPVVPEIEPSGDLGDANSDHISDLPKMVPNPKPEKPKMQASGLKPMPIEPVLGTMVHLKNKDTGAYLHFSGEIMTMEKAHRWKGTPSQALACKRKFDLAAALSMVRADPILPKERT